MKSKTDNQKDKSVFSTRLTALMGERNVTVKDLAKALDFSEQAVRNYKNDERKPDLECLVSIANYFGVSSDYLLGITGAQSKDPNVKDIHRMTGLSENAILTLMSIISDEIKSVCKEHPEYSYNEARSILENGDALWMARLASTLIDDGGTPAEYDFNGELVRGWSRPIFEILGDILLWHKRLGEWEYYDLTGKIRKKDGSVSDEDYSFCFTADQIQNVHLLELNNALIDLHRRLGMRERRS